MRILNHDELISHGNVEGRKIAVEILEAAMQASDPYYNTRKLIRLEDGILYIGNPDYEANQDIRTGVDAYERSSIDRVFVFGAGKGSNRVAKAIEDTLGDWVTGGVIIAKYGDENNLQKVEVVHAGHPVPDENCVQGCRRMQEYIQQAKLTERDLVFTIVCNGASSLLTLPAPGVELKDVMEMTHMMQIECGAPTHDLAYVRNQVDAMKGGRITKLLAPAKMVHILAVDINNPTVAGVSGYPDLMYRNVWLHTMPDATNAEHAIEVLKKWGCWDRVAPSIRNILQNPNAVPPTLSCAEYEAMDCRVFGIMPIESGFMPTAMKMAAERGFTPHLLCRRTNIEASAFGGSLGRISQLIETEDSPFQAPCALFSMGEMLVTVADSKGIGGRNQEFCLALANVIAGSSRTVAVSVDTDGTDGPGGRFDEEAYALGCNNLSGGVVDGYTAQEAKDAGLNLFEAVKSHATSAPLWKLKSGVWATRNISLNDFSMVLISK